MLEQLLGNRWFVAMVRNAARYRRHRVEPTGVACLAGEFFKPVKHDVY